METTVTNLKKDDVVMIDGVRRLITRVWSKGESTGVEYARRPGHRFTEIELLHNSKTRDVVDSMEDVLARAIDSSPSAARRDARQSGEWMEARIG